MHNRIIYFFLVIFFTFVFVILYRGLNNSSVYSPNTNIKDIPKFTADTLIKKKSLNSKDIFNQNKFYLLNIWASWCLPCRDEHAYLLKLRNINKIKIIGINYKDKKSNAIEFLSDLGNPYHEVLVDLDGTKSIELGAIGVPETYLIKNKVIVKKYIGPLDDMVFEKIIEIINEKN